MKRQIAGLAAAALVSGGMSLAALALGAGIAQAETWCPGQPVPGGFTEVDWDWNVCHTYYWVNGKGNVPYDGKLPSDLYDGTNPPPAADNPTCRVIGCAP